MNSVLCILVQWTTKIYFPHQFIYSYLFVAQIHFKGKSIPLAYIRITQYQNIKMYTLSRLCQMQFSSLSIRTDLCTHYKALYISKLSLCTVNMSCTCKCLKAHQFVGMDFFQAVYRFCNVTRKTHGCMVKQEV